MACSPANQELRVFPLPEHRTHFLYLARDHDGRSLIPALLKMWVKTDSWTIGTEGHKEPGHDETSTDLKTQRIHQLRSGPLLSAKGTLAILLIQTAVPSAGMKLVERVSRVTHFRLSEMENSAAMIRLVTAWEGISGLQRRYVNPSEPPTSIGANVRPFDSP